LHCLFPGNPNTDCLFSLSDFAFLTYVKTIGTQSVGQAKMNRSLNAEDQFPIFMLPKHHHEPTTRRTDAPQVAG
ncbi:MAG: hypothetical protein AAFV80_18315, partial [Bacteroidota bacterium]